MYEERKFDTLIKILEQNGIYMYRLLRALRNSALFPHSELSLV